MDKNRFDMRLNITAIGGDGDGIAVLPDGRRVFIPLSVPGDDIRAEVIFDKDGIGHGNILEIITPSNGRDDPPCPHFGACGGCSLQHVHVDRYRAHKIDQVKNTLLKSGIPLPDSFQSIFIPEATRRRANFSAKVKNGTVTIGFHERKSSRVLDVPGCLIITPQVRRVLDAIRPFLLPIIGEGNAMDVLIQCAEDACEIGLTGKIVSGWEAQQALSDALHACGASRISLRARDFDTFEPVLSVRPFLKKFHNLIVELSPCSFLQPSQEGEDALCHAVRQGAGAANSIADLFCGNGTFTGALMKAGRSIWAADSAKESIACLKQTGVDARLRNLFKNPYSIDELDGLDVVVIDPPRSGAKEQAGILAQTDIPVIIYVSCNAQSFARDVKMMQEGGYRLESLTLVDQFIWTAHSEVVGTLRKGH